jgi:hypothetical protein
MSQLGLGVGTLGRGAMSLPYSKKYVPAAGDEAKKMHPDVRVV